MTLLEPKPPGILGLAPCREADFAWMLGETAGRGDLRLPPGGVDAPEVLRLVRSIHLSAGGDADPATWLMIVDGEVVGLCGRSRPVGPGRDVEIGYSVAPARRRRGHAAAAVALLTRAILADPGVAAVTAVTAVCNRPSRRALVRNGFIETARETREEDGPVILWRLDRETGASTSEG